MDPTEADYTNTDSILSGLVVRSLTQFVYDRKTRQMVLVPDLATNLGRPNADFTTWKFTLRPGVRFENGQPVTAQDVKFGIERSFDRETFPGGATFSNQYLLHGDTYQGPYTSPGAYDGVTVNGMTITIHMSKPFPDMSYWGSYPAISPIPRGNASDPARYQNHPWATGPYMFKQGGYVPGKSLVLVRNPFWDPDTDPGRHQYVDEFDMKFGADQAKIDQLLLADAGSARTALSYNPAQGAGYRKFAQGAGDRLVLGSAPCTYFWHLDNRKITDIRVRRALAYAYPYRAAWVADGQIPGVTRIAATNILPPGFPGRTEYNPLPGHTPGNTDTAKAKALLATAGKLNYPVRFPYQTDSPESVAVKNVIVPALSAAGFKPLPVPTTSENYRPDFIFNPEATINVRPGGWCAEWPSGSLWFPALFQTTDIPRDGLGSNLAAFSSKVVDDRIAAIPQLLLTQQSPAWNALDRLIQTKYLPVIVTGYAGGAIMRGSKVHDDFVDTTFGMPFWKDIWLG